MAAEFSSTIDQALHDKRIAGGAAIAIDKSGRELIRKEFGKTSTNPSDAKPFAFDTTLWYASSTKLLTSICALHCVEQGLLKLDDDIATVLPEWKDPQIITGYADDGSPILVKAEQKITLRRLLTHSSGMVYPEMNPSITQYQAAKSKELGYDVAKEERISEYFMNPLIFEPGSSWVYGPSIDWAGRMVEVVTGSKLGEFMAKHIFEPLGMRYSTFDPVGNEEVMSRMTGRVGRNAETGLVGEETSGLRQVRKKEDHHGGSGMYSCANDYIKVLTSLLLDDGKLLPSGGAMMQELFAGQLESPSGLHFWATHPMFGAFLTPGYPRDPETTEWNHSLGGAIVAKEIPGHASKGTLFWSGLPNNYWFVDREAGVAGCYASWILPPGDAPTGEMFGALQRAAFWEAKGGVL
ncbi:hypothetical protein LTR64_000362 [Lithohypha guttulata]|uniref:uncharacterized protein n=1 Tax=Lithohypha guttulata TaxID=1690604 RepID=UPI002DDEEB83|nr:hypothetical protein LTR51_005868 [Lithohypha guttulata]